jgi:hypothetical protein
MDAILPLTSGLIGTIMASNQIPSSQVTTSTANTTSKGTVIGMIEPEQAFAAKSDGGGV